MTREEANAAIAAHVTAAYASLAAAEALATEHKLSFNFSPAYGMGGTFKGELTDEMQKYYYMDEPGWVSSSATC